MAKIPLDEHILRIGGPLIVGQRGAMDITQLTCEIEDALRKESIWRAVGHIGKAKVIAAMMVTGEFSQQGSQIVSTDPTKYSEPQGRDGKLPKVPD